MIFCRGWVGRTNKIEVISGQADGKCLYECADRQFLCHEHIAENTYPPSGDGRFDGVYRSG